MVNKWIATKKECSVNSEGKLLPEKITFEIYKKELFSPHKKEFLDILIRSIAALSIFIPLILLYLQRENEIDKEQAKNVSELYTNVTTDIQLVINSPIYSKEFSSAYDAVLFKYSPKLRLLKDNSLDNIYSTIIASAKREQNLRRIISLKDSMVYNSYNHVKIGRTKKGRGKIFLEISKDKVLEESKKNISQAIELLDYIKKYQKFLDLDPKTPTSIFDFISNLEQLAGKVNIEMISFEEYLNNLDSTYKEFYLDNNLAGKSIEKLDEQSEELAKMLEINTTILENHRSDFEKKMLQIND